MKNSEIAKFLTSMHSRFASACAIVSKAMEKGEISQSRAGFADGRAKTSTVHIADASKLSEEGVRELKAAIKTYNAGHAFQTAFGVKLAMLPEAAKLIPADEVDNVKPITSTVPAPAVETEVKGKKEKKAA